MIEIESLKDYLNKEEFQKLVKSIYKITDFITEDYPDYKEWFFKKQLDGVLNGERNILFVRNPLNSKEIIAVASLKKSKNEKKICTLYVKDKYRNMPWHYANHVKTGEPIHPMLTLKANMEVMAILDAAVRSSACGKEVPVHG